jgi:predicted secreted acid phosphatase
MNERRTDSFNQVKTLRNSTEQTGNDFDQNFEHLVSNGLVRQASPHVFMMDNQEPSSRLRFLSENKDFKYLIYPDDPLKVFWDIVVFL